MVVYAVFHKQYISIACTTLKIFNYLLQESMKIIVNLELMFRLKKIECFRRVYIFLYSLLPTGAVTMLMHLTALSGPHGKVRLKIYRTLLAHI